MQYSDEHLRYLRLLSQKYKTVAAAASEIIRIEALLRRSRSAAEQRLTVGGTVLDYRAMSATCGGKPVPLSAKEFQLLYKLLSCPETLLTKRQLIDELWDLDSDVDEHTVEVHISRLREKFRGCPDFHIRTIRGFGYMALPGGEAHGK